ncbi:MAG TPA: family 20 glycosylhydrolase [Steroidobacteraceae bacterium]|jgi:hexosaminidase
MNRRQTAAALVATLASAVVLTAACEPESKLVVGSAATVSIIPAPREISLGPGAFSVKAHTRVVYSAGTAGAQVARYFVELLQRTQGLSLPLEADTGAVASGEINFRLLGDETPAGPESYSLDVSSNEIVVAAHGYSGLLYGAVTLWQLLASPTADVAVVRVPSLKIVDSPRFAWRGLMLDSARHYQSPQFIKRFIDTMALHKLNVLHWHLTDDQAWRIEIKKYPRLTSVGAWRVPAGPAAAADIDTATGRPRLYGGFYSQDEVRDIVAYASTRNITIVPEIEMPGHASAAIAAYPQLGVTRHPPVAVPADWGVYSALYNVDESTFGFLEDVMTEVMALFPGEYVHVGGDEAIKDEWRSSPQVQARMRELGIKDEHALQSYFIQRIGKFLNAHGRRLVGWDEILEGGLAPDATVMSWRGIDGAVAAAAAGHDAVLSPNPTLYFDNRPLDTPNPPGRGRVVTIEDVYRFDPAPAAIEARQRQHIIGVQANLWTEHVRTEERAEYMTFPRAAALAEVAWSPADRIDWNSLSARLPAQLHRYKLLGINYSRLPPPPPDPAAGVQRRTSHQLGMCTNKLVLSLEDDAPVSGNRAVFLVDIMNPCWIFKAADLSAVATLVAAVGQVPFNFQIGKDVNAIPLPKPQSREGELEVRLDDCNGEKIASLSLAPALSSQAVTVLPAAQLEPRDGRHDLCFIFTRRSVDPTWVIDSIQLQ